MIAELVGFLARNLPAVLFVAALAAAARRGRGGAAERFLSWILLLPIGVTGLWAGVAHIFFPAIAWKPPASSTSMRCCVTGSISCGPRS